MNIFNKTFLAIALAIALPLSMKANWLIDLKNSVISKKKTITAGAILSAAFSYAAILWVNKMTEDELYLKGSENLDNLIKRYKRERVFALMIALWSAGYLTYKAHQNNLFGENPKDKIEN